MAASLSSVIPERTGSIGKAVMAPDVGSRWPMARRLRSIFLQAALSCFKSAAPVCGSNLLAAEYRLRLCNRHSRRRTRDFPQMVGGWHIRPMRVVVFKYMYNRFQMPEESIRCPLLVAAHRGGAATAGRFFIWLPVVS